MVDPREVAERVRTALVKRLSSFAGSEITQETLHKITEASIEILRNELTGLGLDKTPEVLVFESGDSILNARLYDPYTGEEMNEDRWRKLLGLAKEKNV